MSGIYPEWFSGGTRTGMEQQWIRCGAGMDQKRIRDEAGMEQKRIKG